MGQDISFDIIARDKASSTFNKIGKTSGHTSATLMKFGKMAAIGLATAGAAATLAGVKLAKMAADDQQSAALMAKQFKNSARATDAQVAATERWITKQGIAKGVADDDLRPALSQLVVATHKVGAAQKLASLAMNVSAGKGLALSAVSKALAKAATGNVGALGRLGIATKNADGKTKSFAEITKELGKQFAGQALTKANTLQGKMDRLKLIMSETGEAIGYKLIPVLTSLATWILSNGIPALTRFGQWFQTNVIPPMRAAAVFVTSNVVPAFQRIAAAFERVGQGGSRTGAALSQFKANFTSVFASVQSIMTSVAGFAQAFWGRYGDLITKYGMGTLRNLLTVVRGVMNVITGIFKTVAAVLRGDWGGAWDGIKQITHGAVQILKGLVSQLWNLVHNAFQAGGRALVDLMQAAWQGVGAAVRAGVHAELALLASLPGRIAGAIGDLSGILVNAGKSVIQGLINGVKSMIAPLTSTLHAITNLIPKHKGPVSKDRKLLEPAGRAIMDGLIGGIEGKKVSLKRALAKVTDMVQKVGDKLSNLQDIKAGFLSTFQSDSIFGADLSGGGGISDLITFEQNQAAKASQLLADVQRVASMGLSKSLIAQLQSAGSSGADQLHALAGGSGAQIAQLNALDVATSSSLQAAGMYAGNYGRGGSINADIGKASREEDLLNRLVDKLEKLQHADYAVVEIEGEHIVTAIKKRNHKKGVKTAGL